MAMSSKGLFERGGAFLLMAACLAAFPSRAAGDDQPANDPNACATTETEGPTAQALKVTPADAFDQEVLPEERSELPNYLGMSRAVRRRGRIREAVALLGALLDVRQGRGEAIARYRSRLLGAFPQPQGPRDEVRTAMEELRQTLASAASESAVRDRITAQRTAITAMGQRDQREIDALLHAEADLYPGPRRAPITNGEIAAAYHLLFSANENAEGATTERFAERLERYQRADGSADAFNAGAYWRRGRPPWCYVAR